MIGKIALGSAGITLFAGTAYVVGLSAAPAPAYRVSNDQRLSTFEEIAPQYERKTRKQEFYLGIGRMRRRLLQHAEGRVLEVGAGTAVNVGLYPPERCDEVILSDRATGMVQMAEAKVAGRLGYAPFWYPRLPDDPAGPVMLDKATRARQQRRSEQERAAKERGEKEAETAVLSVGSDDHGACCDHGGEQLGHLVSRGVNLTAEGTAALRQRREQAMRMQVERKAAEAAAPSRAEGLTAPPTSAPKMREAAAKRLYAVANYPAERLPFADNEFDTVVDTFGLCSFEDGTAALGEMSRVCRPNGKVLLLEHGRGTWDRLNGYLDKWAPRHAAAWGCWWNRDIRRMIRSAGLTIISSETKHFGTTQLYILAPYKTMHELDLAGRKY